MKKKQIDKNSESEISIIKSIKKHPLTKNLKEAQGAIRKKMFSYIAAGFGLVIGFAWNDAISSLIKQLFPDSAGGIFAKFIYAVLLTVIVGYTLFYLEKALDRESK